MTSAPHLPTRCTTDHNDTGSMDSHPGILSGGALKDIVKVENKKFTLKIKKAAPKPTEAGNWKESDAKSTLQHCCRGCRHKAQ